jgi:hypothetical protein
VSAGSQCLVERRRPTMRRALQQIRRSDLSRSARSQAADQRPQSGGQRGDD